MKPESNGCDNSKAKLKISTCTECGSKYSCKKTLQRHFRLKHPQRLTVISQDVDDPEQLPFQCLDCGARYSTRGSLSKHCKRKNHVKQAIKDCPNSQRKFICHQCSTSFSIKHNLVHHIKKYHILNKPQKNYYFRCCICDFSFKQFNDLCNHFTEHNINVYRIHLSFKELSEFLEWKKLEEYGSGNRYVKHFATKSIKNGEKRATYYCHRSGSFKSKTKGHKRTKIQDSTKMGKICPSRLLVKIDTEGVVKVEYICTHVGHDTNVYPVKDSKKVTKHYVARDHKEVSQEKLESEPDNIEVWSAEEQPKTPELQTNQSESFIESKIKFINELIMLVNDNVNSPEDLQIAYEVVNSLFIKLGEVKKLSTNIPRVPKKDSTATALVAYQTVDELALASTSTTDVEIVHATPVQVLEAAQHMQIQQIHVLNGAQVLQLAPHTPTTNQQLNSVNGLSPLITLETLFKSIG